MIQKDTQWREKVVYCADAGQRVHEERSSNKGHSLKIGYHHALAKYLEQKIVKEHYSPDAAMDALRQTAQAEIATICTKTVYNDIDMGLFAGITNADLPVKREMNRHRHRHIREVALNNTKGQSIDHRPNFIDSWEEEGHWEMDCVVRKAGTKECLLAMTKRKHTTEWVFKMENKPQECVAEILDLLERKYKGRFKKIFKTITVDNGCEFLSAEWLECSIHSAEKRTTIYYAHSYCAWECGTNENQNKIIRRFVPKGMDIGALSEQDVERIQYWINHYPRRSFAYCSPSDLCTLSLLL